MKKIAVLGSTGSIGRQTLDVVRALPEKLKIQSLVAYSDRASLASQAAEFNPNFCALISESGKDCLIKAVRDCDIAVVATRGIVALECAIYCQKNGIDLALANKETLVCGGELFSANSEKKHGICADFQSVQNARRFKTQNKTFGEIFPVDSEHSAIWQCLSAHRSVPAKILLTASGGPFYGWEKEKLRYASAEQALKHPNWNMGKKISVDSATMMNKALEVAEAHFLFGIPVKDIEIVVHRQSVVHSMVQFQSGSVVAQMAVPDMRLPIQLALLGESENIVGNVDFQNLSLTFEKCDEKFPCAKLGHEIFNYPPLCRTVMNAANDVCVETFLLGRMLFDKFYSTIKAVVENFADEVNGIEMSVENIEKYDISAREYTRKFVNGEVC